MESTSEFIIKTIAPIFNKKGYVGTSLSDLTKITKLTKGALYCNFKNKEELAIKSFQYNAKQALNPLFDELIKYETSLLKLKALSNFYRIFYKNTNKIGGCPILNIGIDAKHNCPSLFNEAKKEASKLTLGLSKIIQNGIDNAEIKKNINPIKYAGCFYSMIEGAVFMSMMYEDEKHLVNAMDLIDEIVENQLKEH